MMKRVLMILVLATLILPSGAFAQGWRAVRTGTRNFEKAWRVYTTKQNDRAKAHFEKAADGFAEAMAEDPMSRTARLPSNLTMAGMSFYFSGRYDECIKAMTMAWQKDQRMWESNLFIGLSWAEKGDQTKTIEFFNNYLQSMPSQRILSKTVNEQLEALGKKETGLKEAASVVNVAVQRQFVQNFSTNYSPRSLSPTVEQCGGPYWWRRNNAPCAGGDYW